MAPLTISRTIRVLALSLLLAAGAAWTGSVRAEGDSSPLLHESRPVVRPSAPRPAVRPAPPSASPEEAVRERVNGGVIGLVTARVGGTYVLLASEMAIVLDQDDDLRILPIITKGSIQNIRDLLYLRGVDLAIVQSDVLDFLEGQKTYANIKKRITYIAPLYLEEFHLVGRKDIRTIEDLAGKVVNFGEAGSGGAMTASLVFQKLGISVKPVNMAPSLALENLKSGEIAATVYVSGKPNQTIAALKAEDELRLVPVPVRDTLARTYHRSEFQPQDYPNLIEPDERIETVAVTSLLAAYNWPVDSDRYKRVARFVEAFFTKFQDFQKPPFHPKWKEVDLRATLPGWTRMPAVQEWLDHAGASREPVGD